VADRSQFLCVLLPLSFAVFPSVLDYSIAIVSQKSLSDGQADAFIFTDSTPTRKVIT